ncbi:MAG: hypothetical protein IJ041_01485, partial [Clostridia bacterium]|nr:hypothetical protein [Clostridia bacterium]
KGERSEPRLEDSAKRTAEPKPKTDRRSGLGRNTRRWFRIGNRRAAALRYLWGFFNSLSRSRRCGFLHAENKLVRSLSFLPVTGEARKPSLYFCFVNSIKILDTRFNSLYTTNLKMKTIFIR